MANEKKTTVTPSGELAPLEERKANRAKAREEAKAERGDFNHAAELADIARAEREGERGPVLASGGGQDGGTDDGGAVQNTGGWGKAAAEGVTASAPVRTGQARGARRA